LKIKNVHIALILFLFQLLILEKTEAQEIDLKERFESIQKDNFQEKIYLHTDQDFYVCGETIWFKIYCVDGSSHHSINVSKIAYVEIINAESKAVIQAKIEIKDGFGNGHLILSESLTSGNYNIRAYTNWMKNFHPDFYFEKQIILINSLENISIPAKSHEDDLRMAFFPEGGNLVENIESSVGFQILKNGLGIQATGSIVNQFGQVVSSFSTLNYGMGNFSFSPKVNENYKAILKLENGIEKSFDLPKVASQGYVLKLSETDKNLSIQIQGNLEDDVYLLNHTRGVLNSINQLKLKDGKAHISIDKTNIGDGITHFTLFNFEKKPVCERLYFKFPEKMFYPQVLTDKKRYNPREKIEIDIKSNNIESSTNMSIAVYRIDSSLVIDKTNITNYLWLTSDLTGIIENPNYYFENEGIGRADDLNNLMLCHGWRRFNWEQESLPSFEFLPEIEGHLLKARITNTFTNTTASNTQVFVSAMGKETQFATALSDMKGYATINFNNFHTENELIVQNNGSIDSLKNIEVLNPFSNQFSQRFSTTSTLYSRIPNIEQKHNGVQIAKAFPIPPSEPIPPFLNGHAPFYGKPDFTYQLDDYVRFPLMEDVLREYVAPVLVRKKANDYSLFVFNPDVGHTYETEPLILLDGTPIFNANAIMNYNPFKVEKLEIVDKQYYFRNLAFNGILNFKTYSGKMEDFKFGPKTIIIDYEGLQKQREFHSPIYETDTQKKNRLPDFRQLMYWNPNISIDQLDKKRLNFYTSDLTGNYIIEIEGINRNSETGTGTAFFEVKK
jgi:hypothetical protein